MAADQSSDAQPTLHHAFTDDANQFFQSETCRCESPVERCDDFYQLQPAHHTICFECGWVLCIRASDRCIQLEVKVHTRAFDHSWRKIGEISPMQIWVEIPSDEASSPKSTQLLTNSDHVAQ